MVGLLLFIFTFLMLPALYCYVAKKSLSSRRQAAEQEQLEAAKQEQLEAAKRKKEAAVKALVARQNMAERLLKRCQEAGISSLDTEDDTSKVWIIAESMGVTSKEEAVALYREGQNPSKEAAEAVEIMRAESRASWREYELDKLKRSLADYPPNLIGRDKYTAWALALRTRVQKEIGGYEASSKVMSTYPSAHPTPQVSVTKEAMKGQLVGGAGLAAAKAIKTQNLNARSSAASADIAAGMSKLSFAYSRKAEELEWQLKRINRYLRSVNSKLIDTEHSDKYASMIEGHVSKAKLTCGGNLMLDIDFNITDEPEILGKEAFLDGVIDITATLDGNTIGSRTYCRPLSNCPRYSASLNKDLNEIYLIGKVHTGLQNNLHIQRVLMIVTANITEADIPNMVFEITPRTVWAVEGTRDGFLHDFSSI